MSKKPAREIYYIDNPAEPVVQLLALWVNNPPDTVLVFRPQPRADGSWLIRVVPAGVAINEAELESMAACVIIPGSAAASAGEAVKRAILLRAVLERALISKFLPDRVPDRGTLPEHTPWYSYGGDGSGNGGALLPCPVDRSKAFANAWEQAAADYINQKAGAGFVHVTLC